MLTEQGGYTHTKTNQAGQVLIGEIGLSIIIAGCLTFFLGGIFPKKMSNLKVFLSCWGILSATLIGITTYLDLH